jgi:integrase
VSVNEVLLAFMQWATTHYRTPDGKPTSEIDELKWSLRCVRELYGNIPASEFGPRALAAVRQHMIGLNWCRTLINHRIDRVKRVFKWATSEELVLVNVYVALRTLAGLQKGRTEARESEPVKPVDPNHVTATLPRLNRHVRTMVELQRLTGMRPGEVCGLTFGEVDRTGDIWFYRPGHHKTAHRGKQRVVAIGPRAQALLAAFLVGDNPPSSDCLNIKLTDDTARLVAADAYQEAGRTWDAELLRDLTRSVVLIAGCVVDPSARVFSPVREREDRFRTMRAKRQSKVQPSQLDRKKANPKRAPGEAYYPRAYAHAIAVACKKVGIARWHPNQLRHLFATEVRKEHGLEAAQVLLGHSRADVTEVYAERDQRLAATVAAKVG